MKIYRPRKIGKLIISKTYIKGPKGGTILNLLVDTGATYTIIESEILRQIVCNPAMSKDTRQIITASGRVTVPRVQIAQIHCFGQLLENYHVLAHVFPIEVYFYGVFLFHSVSFDQTFLFKRKVWTDYWEWIFLNVSHWK